MPFSKYGFQDANDFQLITQGVIRLFRTFGMEFVSLLSSKAQTDTENTAMEEPDTKRLLVLLEEISENRPDLMKLSTEQCRMFLEVFEQRKDELFEQFIREHNALEYSLVTAFDWDVRLVMGDSSYSENRHIITTLTLNLLKNKKDSSGQDLHPSFENEQLHLQMNREMLDKIIETFEKVFQNNSNDNSTSSNSGD